MNTETWIVFCCGLVTVAVTSWLWRRAETRYSQADARIEELDKDQLFTAQRESDKWAAREEAHCRQIGALQEKLAATEAIRLDQEGYDALLNHTADDLRSLADNIDLATGRKVLEDRT